MMMMMMGNGYKADVEHIITAFGSLQDVSTNGH
jgi:hypothetical protein